MFALFLGLPSQINEAARDRTVVEFRERMLVILRAWMTHSSTTSPKEILILRFYGYGLPESVAGEDPPVSARVSFP